MQAAPGEPKEVEWGRSTASDLRALNGEAAGSTRNAASILSDQTPALMSDAALVLPQEEGRACPHSSTFLAGRAVVPASAQQQVDRPGARPGATNGVPAVVAAAAVSAAWGGARAGGAGACGSVLQRHLPPDTPAQRSKPTLRVTDVTSGPPPLTPMSYTPRRTQLDDRTLQYLMSKWGGRAQQLELQQPGPEPPAAGAACSDASAAAAARPSQGSDSKLQSPRAAASGHRTGPPLTGTQVDTPRVVPEEGPTDSDATAGDRTKTETPEATQGGGHGTHGSLFGLHGRVRSPALAGDRTMTDSPEVGGLLAAALPGRGRTGVAASSEKKPSRRACTASQKRGVGSPGVGHAASRASGDGVALKGETSRGPTPASAPGTWADSCEQPSPAAASAASPASRAEGGDRGEFSTPGPVLAPAQEADDDTEHYDAESHKSLALGDINTRLDSVDSRASRRGKSVAASTGSRAASRAAADISGFNMDRYEGESSVSTECPEIRESLMANSPESRGSCPTSSSSARSVGSWRRTIESASPDGTPSLQLSQGASPHGDAHDSSSCHSPIRPYFSDQHASPAPPRLSTEALSTEALSRNGARTASRAEAPQGGEGALEEGEQAAPATLIHVNAQELTFLPARPEGEGGCEQVLLVRNASPGPVALSYTCLGEDMASSSPAFKVCGSMLDAAPILAPGQTSTLTVSCDASAFPRSATAAGAEDAGEAPDGNGGVLAIVAMAVSEMHKAGVRGSSGEAFCQHVSLRCLPPLPGARPSSTSSPQPAPSSAAASSAAVASTRCTHTTDPATLGPETPAEGSRRSTPNATRGVLPDTPKQPTDTCPSRDSPGARTDVLSLPEPGDDAAACPGAAMHGSAAKVERADKTALQRGAVGAVDGDCLAVPAATHCLGAAEVPAVRRGAGGAVEGDMWFVDVIGVDLGRIYIQDRNQCILGGTECGEDDGAAKGGFSVVNPSGVDLHFHVRVISPAASSASSPAFVVASAGADVQQASASLVLTVPARHSRQLWVGIDARAYDFSGCVCCRGELSISTLAHPHDLTALLNPPGCHALDDAAGPQRADVVAARSASVDLACEVGFCRLQVAGEVEEVQLGCCRGDQAQHVIGNVT